MIPRGEEREWCTMPPSSVEQLIKVLSSPPLEQQQQQPKLETQPEKKPHQQQQWRGPALKEPHMLTNCSEGTKAIYITVELPNVKQEDIHVTFDERTRELCITATSRLEPLREGEVFLKCERRYGKMSRTFVLPDFVTSDGATAEFKEDSVLRISFRKKKRTRTLHVNCPAGKREGAS